MASYDYVIVGPDTNPFIAMPRGFGELLGDPATAWHYPTRPFGPEQQVPSKSVRPDRRHGPVSALAWRAADLILG